ncbi:hypothetical protein CYMTET_6655 [Cymbomonas tetramitiformis]|uniref:Bifunctional lysine-specific demethylase and histidyl-hydroxylase n=1 Tax=Cymbomonas tetramitiformis TaxID=36881 RepID=A0AAE0LHT7_9CHLO|nr:hypothetical protein CYMTET_6655 [Cymbomonas tetramitiformis]
MNSIRALSASDPHSFPTLRSVQATRVQQPHTVVTARRILPVPRRGRGVVAAARARRLSRRTVVCYSSLDLGEKEFGDLDEVNLELSSESLDFFDHFLEHYWQKRPLLIRQAIPDFSSPVEADDLAGLACDSEVSSRIILEKDGSEPWELRHGPFDEEDFFALPETHWSLLVEGADRFVPPIAELLDLFTFIPRWRCDDIMVSYSPEGGSVGPHSDNYDVFLLQANGAKSWAVNAAAHFHPDDFDAHEEGLEVRILKDFSAEAQRVLQPGDVLYLPPRVAHHGVTLQEGMTYSVGFLAPKHQDLLTSYINSARPTAEVKRWEDPWLKLQALPA